MIVNVFDYLNQKQKIYYEFKIVIIILFNDFPFKKRFFQNKKQIKKFYLFHFLLMVILLFHLLLLLVIFPILLCNYNCSIKKIKIFR